MKKENINIGIIGGGPSGLTASYLLSKEGINNVVFEKDKKYLGGISRTEVYKGYRFDIGGHRFFSKSQEVEDFWTEILEKDLLNRPRSSRIYYKNKFFSYPLKAFEALFKLGILNSTLCVLSYLRYKAFPIKNPKNFQDWVTNQFGKRLFNIFFKTYTEKVWGIPCDQISADWAAQRIKGLSLTSAIINALKFNSSKTKDGEVIKTLIEEFRYPKFGPGMMWEVCAEKSQKMGAVIKMGVQIDFIEKKEDKWILTDKKENIFGPFDYVITSSPMKEFIPSIKPKLCERALKAVSKLSYRDFLTVVLICEDKESFKDNWIYIHDSKVKVGRIQNFKSWSPYLVPDSTKSCYGLEYFCFEGDGLWTSSDKDLIELGSKEITQIGLCSRDSIVDGYVVRQPKAYPVYDEYYKDNLEIVKQELKNHDNLYLVGRNGMHKYNNQDHSMMTSMLAVKNIIASKNIYDLWSVNEDAEYHESTMERKTPQKI